MFFDLNPRAMLSLAITWVLIGFLVALAVAADPTGPIGGLASNEVSTLAAEDTSLPWNKLKVTWGKFNSLPYTEQDAINAGWTLTPCKAAAANVCSGDDWFGYRYVLDGDLATMLLFDSNGQLAGIQAGLVQTPPTPENLPPWLQQNCPSLPPHYIITAYTRNPDSICGGAAATANPIGDRLWLAYPGSYMQMSLTESNVSAPWVQGKCFWTMGMHYWANATSSMSCDAFFPVFLLYNKGILTGFGWTYTGYQPSPRYEHPHGSVIKLFIPSTELPQCLIDATSLSTMHYYFTEPLLSFC